MKVGILAGGHGTRLAEETEIKPKPMVEIGGRPILWHIMMHYSCYGHDTFVIALGFKGCLLYTSDAADERSSVDFGGPRFIKKKTNVLIDGAVG